MIEGVIKELIGQKDYKVTWRHTILRKSMGLASEHGFVTLQLGERRHKFFIKMARTCHDSGRILREIEILRKLRDKRVENIPEVVLHGVCEGRAYLVENFIEKAIAPQAPLYRDKMLSNMLEWMRRFYFQTESGTVEPKELIQRAERVSNFANEFIDLTDALYVLDKSKPNAKIPAVCRHGDIADVNFIPTSCGLVAINFGFARFNEPPSESYALVSPAKLKGDTKYLDVLSVFDGVDPSFFAMYENIIRLGEKLEMMHDLEKNFLLINRIGYVAQTVQFGNIEKLQLHYQEPHCSSKVRS